MFARCLVTTSSRTFRHFPVSRRAARDVPVETSISSLAVPRRAISRGTVKATTCANKYRVYYPRTGRNCLNKTRAFVSPFENTAVYVNAPVGTATESSRGQLSSYVSIATLRDWTKVSRGRRMIYASPYTRAVPYGISGDVFKMKIAFYPPIVYEGVARVYRLPFDVSNWAGESPIIVVR